MRFGAVAVPFSSTLIQSLRIDTLMVASRSAPPTGPLPYPTVSDQASSGNALPARETLAGGLRILESLGSTPDGLLYQAKYPNGREVALLVLQPTALRDERSRWEQFRLATQIQHPNVAAVYAVGEMEDGSAYAVLEQLDGEPLSDALEAGRRYAFGEALDLALQTAAGLQAAHRAGFIHGNLSPRTILVTRPPFGRSQVKLIGFNLAPADRQTGAPPGEGSVPYASPQRLGGHSAAEQDDVFSLGAVLHHLITGTAPVQGRVAGAMPGAARVVLEEALAPDRAERYRTMSELHEALERLVSGAVKPGRAGIPRSFLIRATAAGLAVATVGIWLLSGSKRREPGEVPRSTPTAAPAPAPAGSPVPAPPAAPRLRNNTADSDQGRPGTRATPPRRAVPPRPGSAGPAEAPPTRSTATGGRVAPPSPVEGPEVGRREEGSVIPVTRGYAGAPAASSDSDPAPDDTRGAQIVTARPVDSITPIVKPRSRDELEQDQGLRHAIGDVVRLGLAENVAERRPGLLVVFLNPDGMNVPSAAYNLQRLYLAYSAATRQQADVAIELRQEGDLYGRFTREGLTYPSSD